MCFCMKDPETVIALHSISIYNLSNFQNVWYMTLRLSSYDDALVFIEFDYQQIRERNSLKNH